MPSIAELAQYQEKFWKHSETFQNLTNGQTGTKYKLSEKLINMSELQIKVLRILCEITSITSSKDIKWATN